MNPLTSLSNSAQQRGAWAWVGMLALWAMPMALGSLAGCTSSVKSSPVASGSVVNSAGRRDVATDSDESESRKRAKIRLELAVGYFEQGKTTVALDELKQALVSDPNYGEAYTLRGLVYMRLNDLRLAEDSFKEALRLNPQDANAAHNYGWLACQASRFDDAQRLFALALSNPLYGDQGRTYLTQGICYSRAGNDAQAERSLGRAFEIDAGNPVAGYNLATLLFRREEFGRAQFYLRRLNSGEYANEETLWLAAKTEMKLNNRDAANELGAQLVRKYPGSRQARAFQRQAFNE